MQLEGKNAIITGGSIGLGLAIAMAYVLEGANICICARSVDQLEQAKDLLENKKRRSDQIVFSTLCDVSKREDVERLFVEAEKHIGEIDILVNNAGVYGPKGPSEDVDITEWMKAVEINLTGTFHACQQAINRFKKMRSGKVINLSGGGATAPLPNLSSYAVSKAAVVRLTETLAEEVKEFGIDINAIAPGALNTRLLDEVLEAGPEKVGQGFYEKALKQQKNGGAGLEKGAQLSVFLASSKSDGITGKLISAVWDSWATFDKHLDDIKNTDIFTLRRILTKERGLEWE
jgi:NAD(P)-dependent dehydrogenase (short-subunit alcohol dehydrogenase family)